MSKWKPTPEVIDASRRFRRAKRLRSTKKVLFGAVLVGAVGAGYAYDRGQFEPVQALMQSASCNIKGNVSIDTGERVYHVPGQSYYEQTVISPRYGERWFCSEAEARRAGWRRSKV